ncbi:MAG: hypothetical protein ABI083_14270 [Lapillicoccus sp.]
MTSGRGRPREGRANDGDLVSTSSRRSEHLLQRLTLGVPHDTGALPVLPPSLVALVVHPAVDAEPQVVVAGGVSIVAFFGGMGSALQPFSPVIAVVLAIVLPPVLALATKGKYYLRRSGDGIDLPTFDGHGNPSAAELACVVCGETYERPDMLASATGEGSICSLCLATDRVGTHILSAT